MKTVTNRKKWLKTVKNCGNVWKGTKTVENGIFLLLKALENGWKPLNTLENGLKRLKTVEMVGTAESG